MMAIKSQGTSTARQAVGTHLRATLGIMAVALLALTACGTAPPLPDDAAPSTGAEPGGSILFVVVGDT